MGAHPRARRRLLLLLAAVGLMLAVVVTSAALRTPRIKGAMSKRVVRWERALPGQEGLDPETLAQVSRILERGGAETFLVVRGGRLVHEWYAPGWNAEQRHYTAAQAKAVVASPLVWLALSDGYVGFDDPGSEHLPSWRSDPVRSKILVRHLLSHSSGIENVEFTAGEAGELGGWQGAYFEQPATRFRSAVEEVPIIFTPGSRYAYSGVAFYALAYVLGRALEAAPERDFEALLRDRLMRPLGIPDEAWEMSYGESYDAEGIPLRAVGSGAGFTARALARVGQLFLDEGRLNGQEVVSGQQLRRLLSPRRLPPFHEGHEADPVPAGGWWTNASGAWASLPSDAYAGIGRGGQMLLVVPSLDLVAVRSGRGMNSENCFLDCPYESEMFEPLMNAVVGSGSRER